MSVISVDLSNRNTCLSRLFHFIASFETNFGKQFGVVFLTSLMRKLRDKAIVFSYLSNELERTLAEHGASMCCWSVIDHCALLFALQGSIVCQWERFSLYSEESNGKGWETHCLLFDGGEHVATFLCLPNK